MVALFCHSFRSFITRLFCWLIFLSPPSRYMHFLKCVINFHFILSLSDFIQDHSFNSCLILFLYSASSLLAFPLFLFQLHLLFGLFFKKASTYFPVNPTLDIIQLFLIFFLETPLASHPFDLNWPTNLLHILHDLITYNYVLPISHVTLLINPITFTYHHFAFH